MSEPTVKMLNPFNATEKEDFNNVASPGVGSGNPAPIKQGGNHAFHRKNKIKRNL